MAVDEDEEAENEAIAAEKWKGYNTKRQKTSASGKGAASGSGGTAPTPGDATPKRDVREVGAPSIGLKVKVAPPAAPPRAPWAAHGQ